MRRQWQALLLLGGRDGRPGPADAQPARRRPPARGVRLQRQQHVAEEPPPPAPPRRAAGQRRQRARPVHGSPHGPH